MNWRFPGLSYSLQHLSGMQDQVLKLEDPWVFFIINNMSFIDFIVVVCFLFLHLAYRSS